MHRYINEIFLQLVVTFPPSTSLTSGGQNCVNGHFKAHYFSLYYTNSFY